MTRCLFNILFITYSFSFAAQELSIGIYQNHSFKQLLVVVEHGTYSLEMDSEQRTIEAGSANYLWCKLQKVSLKHFGTANQIRFVASSPDCVLRVKPLDKPGEEKLFKGALSITSLGTSLKVINQIELEDYVAGVVEAESGSKQNEEYYKIQAIISRTYALSNLNRHLANGFQLCDQVHCQVFNGMSRFNPIIPLAVKSNSGVVITDCDLNLINASYHSNCGGQTLNAEDVWSKPLPYLKSRRDTFCLNGNHAFWETKVDTFDWLEHFKQKYNITHFKDQEIDRLLNYNPDYRSKYIQNISVEIPLSELRNQWRLKSTNFEVCSENGTTHLEGKGFGHGVGLCQEGAIHMTELGLGYFDIINYYYADIHLLHLSILDFFKEN